MSDKTPPSPRRHPAGANPQKRAQILAGAETVFLEKGFEQASVAAIAAAAGVSKGTIYVYFSDKEEMFRTLIQERRSKMLEGSSSILHSDRPLPERMEWYGCRVASAICSDASLRAQHIVIGAMERNPAFGPSFLDTVTAPTLREIGEMLSRAVDEGEMSVPDIPLAAAQFLELLTAGIWRRRLFGARLNPPTDDEIRSTVQSAVTMMLAAYRAC
ncbi:TetR/AcrR family transcriptional regulator [Falsirhodobacter sp. alg1]|uniref:TetR/AcrR family transcriptional regulator n=1 Tax=Falsirhodobacter sp. alg1 TaxID=1472418 RepID=UPI0005EEA7CC|nr:TetR/AcrR family transcriptional regulator [Falsirhodobacter sp. alg1]